MFTDKYNHLYFKYVFILLYVYKKLLKYFSVNYINLFINYTHVHTLNSFNYSIYKLEINSFN